MLDFKPQQAKKADSVAEAVSKCGDPIMELKYDGWRMIVTVTEDGPRLWSRAGKEYTGRAPEMEEVLSQLPPGTILDGEVVDLETHNYVHVTNVFGKSKAKATEEERAKLTYVAFDGLSYGGKDWATAPLYDRRNALDPVIQGLDTSLVKLSDLHTCSQEQFETFLEDGLEGAIVKDLNMPYMKGKRGHGWFKLKGIEEMDVVIMDLLMDGKGKYAGLVGRMVVGQYQDGELVEVAKVNCPDDAQRKDMTANPDSYIGRVFEMKHYGKIKDGYRHPNWVRWREDKLAEECVPA